MRRFVAALDDAHAGGVRPRAARFGRGARRRRAARPAIAESHGLAMAPRRLVRDLSVGERQRVEILKALYRGARTLILDEPTAVLTPPEVDELLAMLARLVARGGTAVLVTHKLDEVMAIAQQVSILRRGELVMTGVAEARALAAHGGVA